MQETFTVDDQEYCHYAAQGPTFASIAERDAAGRDYVFHQRVRNDEGGIPTHTEQQGIEQLDSFLSRVADVAAHTENNLLRDEVEAFRQNLVFIGEPERAAAIDGMAHHILEKMERGEEIYIYYSNTRSEQYTALLLTERLEALLAPINKDALKEIHVSPSSRAIADQVATSNEQSAVIVVDDFALSGTRTRGGVTRMQDALLAKGFSQEQALDMIEANLIAARRKDSYKVSPVGDGKAEVPFRMFAYYAVDEYFDEDGKWRFYPGASVTGSHCSTDYGFESVIEDFNKALGLAGEPRQEVWLTNIRRPYDGATWSSDPDPEYLERTAHMEERFGIPSRGQRLESQINVN